MTVVKVSTPGPQGAPGNTINTTSGAPSASLGNNGDYALDPTAQIIYGPKAAGAWPAGVSIKGETGSDGTNGTNGTNGAQGPQGVPGAGAKWQTGQVHNGFIATRAKIFDDSDSGNFQSNSRSIHIARAPITTLGVDLANWFVTSAHSPLGERGNGDIVTVRASLEYPLGTIVGQFTFSGSATGTIYDGTTLSSDAMTGLNIPNGATFAIREWRQYGPNANGVLICGSGMLQGMNATAGDCFEFAASGLSDRTGTPGSFTSSSSTLYSRPVAVWGSLDTPSYALIGDSRVVGAADDGSQVLDLGETAPSIGALRGYSTLAFIGETLAGIQVSSGQGYSMRASIIRKRATHIISNYGVNDCYQAVSPPNLQQILAYADWLRNLFPGHWFYNITIPGETLPGQPTESASASALLLVNQLNGVLMSGLANNDGTFDVASVLQTPRTLGVWNNAAWVNADGIHETITGCAQILSSGVIVVH